MTLESVITEANPGFLFCLQLILATGIYCLYLKRRAHFIPKAIDVLVIFPLFGYFLDIQPATSSLMVPFEIYIFLIPLLFFLFSCNMREIIFVSIAGMATQHCILLIDELLLYQLLPPMSDLAIRLLEIPTYLFLCLFAYSLLGRRIYREIDIRIRPRSLLLVAAAVLLFTMVLRRMVTDNLGDTYSNTLKIAVDLYGVASCVICLWLLFFANIIDEMKMEQMMMEDLMRMEEQKHSFTEDTIETLNLKCHDLKHQIERLRTGQHEISDQELQDMEQSVTSYMMIAQTGNDVLDDILTEESLCCERYHIQLSCIVDGKCLKDMDSTDLYSLFGNAVDNAVEASRKEPDEDKRRILVKVSANDAYITIHIENNCPSEVKFSGGIPQTDKPDRARHGMGVRSMQYVVGKYDGNLVFNEEDGLFSLNIILPSDLQKAASKNE